MTIQDIGSLGEMIAAIATVATLAYLAMQIRANSTLMRAESHRAVTDKASQVGGSEFWRVHQERFSVSPEFRAFFEKEIRRKSQDAPGS